MSPKTTTVTELDLRIELNDYMVIKYALENAKKSGVDVSDALGTVYIKIAKIEKKLRSA